MTLRWRKVGRNWRIHNGSATWWVLDNEAAVYGLLLRLKARE